MTQTLDLNKPAQGAGLISAEMRNNLQSLASASKGPIAPLGASLIDGLLWVDDSDGLNIKLKQSIGGVWVTLFEHLESVPQPGSGGGQFTHTQAVAAATWTITHNLSRYPKVTVVDSTTDPAQVIEPDSVRYLSVNQLEVTFIAAQVGRAFVN